MYVFCHNGLIDGLSNANSKRLENSIVGMTWYNVIITSIFFRLFVIEMDGELEAQETRGEAILLLFDLHCTCTSHITG